MPSWWKAIPAQASLLMACSLGGTLLTTTAHGQTLDEARAQADALFREGQQLMTAGQMAAGCAKLEESQRLDPKLGRLLNVAYCHEHLGRTATAWSEYNQAAALALQMGQSERETFARTQAGVLARKLSFVRIDLTNAGDLSHVAVDGREIVRDQWAIPFPIDPGDHTLTFAAAGYKTRTQTITISAAGTVGVAMDALEPEAPERASTPPPATTGPTMAVTAGSTASDSTPAAPKERGGTRTLGWIVGAIGAGALGAGVGFGLRAMSLQSQADPLCPLRVCGREGKALIDDAQTAATISTIGFIAGGVGIGVGAWLILRSPPTSAPHVAAYFAGDRAGMSLQGTW